MDTCADRRFNGHAAKLAAVGFSVILALVAGTAVYLLDRDWASTLFLAHFASWQVSHSGFFGVPGNNLPSFFHAYAFALLLILLLGQGRHSRWLGASLWFATASTLECLQTQLVKSWFDGMTTLAEPTALLAGIHTYIENGYFDPGDLAAAALGCMGAWAASFVLEDTS